MADGIPEMARPAGLVREFLTTASIDPNGLTTRAGLSGAVLALSNPAARARFDTVPGNFLTAVDRVLPCERAPDHLHDVRTWGVLQMRVRRHYRDDTGDGFALRGAGVRGGP
ncbi:MAG TPA: hypothetical protein VIU15_28255 [Streptomyces sp.]